MYSYPDCRLSDAHDSDLASAPVVSEKTVVIEGIGGAWVLQIEGRSPERFQTRLQAMTRADHVISRMPAEWTILVKPAPSSIYR